MTISFEKNEAESQLTAHIEGSLDTITSDSFLKQMNVAAEGIKLLILDFSNVDYISSSGLRAVFNLNKQVSVRGTMCLKNLNAEVREIFEVSGFDRYVDIKD